MPQVANESAEHGGKRREGQALRAELEAATDEHPGGIGGGPLGELADQPGLADPRFTTDQHG